VFDAIRNEKEDLSFRHKRKMTEIEEELDNNREDLQSEIQQHNRLRKHTSMLAEKLITFKYTDHPNNFQEKHRLLWISEETHEIKKDISLLMVENNTYIESGTEIIKDIKTENAGYLKVIEENGIVEKIIIKVGKIIRTTEEIITYSEVIEVGEKICKGITAEYSCLVEKINEGILIRPADEYYINKKQFQIETGHSLNGSQSIGINFTQNLLFKEGEKIESINGVDLVKTYLTVDICSNQIHGSADVEFLETENKGEYKLQIAIIENLQIKQDAFSEDSKQQIRTNFCVEDGQEILSGALVAQTSLIFNSSF
jgi:DNA-directed RNA polymerase subunit beta'